MPEYFELKIPIIKLVAYVYLIIVYIRHCFWLIL